MDLLARVGNDKAGRVYEGQARPEDRPKPGDSDASVERWIRDKCEAHGTRPAMHANVARSLRDAHLDLCVCVRTDERLQYLDKNAARELGIVVDGSTDYETDRERPARPVQPRCQIVPARAFACASPA